MPTPPEPGTAVGTPVGTPAGTRGRIVDLLRRAPATANDVASRIGLTHNAVRAHLAALQRDGVVREAGMRPSASRPAVLYELTPDTDALLSRAYAPFAAALVGALGDRLPEPEVDALMRDVGARLAAVAPRPRGDLAARVLAASAALTSLGGANDVVRDDADGFVVRGHGCPLAAATRHRPEVCRAMETFVAALAEAPARERCERGERPRCRFEIGPAAARA